MTATRRATSTYTTQRQLRSGPGCPWPGGRSGRPGRRSLGFLLICLHARRRGEPIPWHIRARRFAVGYPARAMSSASHCARPGCTSAPVAVLTYDYAQRTAWLDDVGRAPQGTTWLLCLTHADTLRVPVGWQLEDRRSEVVAIRSDLAS